MLFHRWILQNLRKKTGLWTASSLSLSYCMVTYFTAYAFHFLIAPPWFPMTLCRWRGKEFPSSLCNPISLWRISVRILQDFSWPCWVRTKHIQATWTQCPDHYVPAFTGADPQLMWSHGNSYQLRIFTSGFIFESNWKLSSNCPYLKMGILRLFPAAMYGALMLWQKRMNVRSR